MGEVANIQRDRLFVLGYVVHRGVTHLPLDAGWDLVLEWKFTTILLDVDDVHIKFQIRGEGVGLPNPRLAQTFGISSPGIVDEFELRKPENRPGFKSRHIHPHKPDRPEILDVSHSSIKILDGDFQSIPNARSR